MSRSADAVVGMMDGAYFVGRKELLDFFNDLLDLNLSKIEQTCSGAVACQLTELIFPDAIQMSRVNWEAKSDYEYVQNYKLLQAAFTKHHVQRHVDVDKLIRGKYQDNLEFCQWLKAFYDQAGGGASGGRRDEEYNPRAVRARGKGGKRFNDAIPIKKGGGSSSSSTFMSRGGGGATNKRAPPPPPPPRATITTKTAAKTTTSSAKATMDNVDRESRPLRERPADGGTNRAPPPHPPTMMADHDIEAAVMADAQLLKKNAELSIRVEELETNMVEMERERDQAVLDIEKERDFYFDKLRSVEVILQVHQERVGPGPAAADASGEHEQQQALMNQQLVDKIFQILYATAEDNLVVNDEGDVVEAATIAVDGQQDLADTL